MKNKRKSGVQARGILMLLAFLVGAPTHAADFAVVSPGREFQFPRDHGAHPDFKTEWWYFTGHLEDAEGRTYGFQWTVFRAALRPPGAESRPSASPWRAEQIYLGHVALSDLSAKSFSFEESSARAALGLAGASRERFQVWLPGFSAETSEAESRLHARKGNLGLDLALRLPDQVWLQGRGGYSPKAREAGKASYYYSVPNLPVRGKLKIGEKEVSVQGQAWMDHEFGSGQLGSQQSGWDWMALPLGRGKALMVYRLRDRQTPSRDFLYGGFFQGPGKYESLASEDIQLEAGSLWKSPRSSARYPLAWRVRVPKHGLDLQVKAVFPDQELDTAKSTQVIYWEGSVEISGRFGERKIDSKGYLEMTGYARDFEQELF